MNRRHVIALPGLLLQAPLALCAAQPPWFLGRWRSDPEMSARSFSLHGTIVTGSERDRARSIFGHVVLEFTPTLAVHTDDRFGPNRGMTSRYTVESATDNTVRLVFLDAPFRTAQPSMTLYRAEPNFFVRSGSNLEYFRRETR